MGTGWVVLDCELMPWSVKAQELVREQYAAVGAAARTSLSNARSVLQHTEARGIDTGETLGLAGFRATEADVFQSYTAW